MLHKQNRAQPHPYECVIIQLTRLLLEATASEDLCHCAFQRPSYTTVPSLGNAGVSIVQQAHPQPILQRCVTPEHITPTRQHSHVTEHTTSNIVGHYMLEGLTHLVQTAVNKRDECVGSRRAGVERESKPQAGRIWGARGDDKVFDMSLYTSSPGIIVTGPKPDAHNEPEACVNTHMTGNKQLFAPHIAGEGVTSWLLPEGTSDTECAGDPKSNREPPCCRNDT